MAERANGHPRGPFRQTSERQDTPTTTEHVSNTDFKSSSPEMPESGTTTETPISREGTPPPLPPRPEAPPSPNTRPSSSEASLKVLQPSSSSRPRSASRLALQSGATTALSLADVQTQSHGGDETLTSPTSRHPSFAAHQLGAGRGGSDADDSGSVRSFAPTMGAAAEIQSMLGDALPVKSVITPRAAPTGQEEEKAFFPEDQDFEDAFEHEFDELDDITSDGLNEEAVIHQWKAKLKHFMILSSAGKPIWTRHGNDQIITSYIGVIQTLISFYQEASDVLRGFTAGDVQFVVMTRGSLNLVAISKIQESDAQLRVQLEALYMQILSTLTLPVMERMFRARASTDLRQPLQGTEKLLSALADGFTRGSPSTLLSALECLKLRKSHRNTINNSLLRTKCADLLYGLIVAGGRLVSVVRPRKHSLHPGDLHLIFNMLFEAGSVKAAGGENWIPLCLPGFNNTGYLYMYVSFLNLEHPTEEVVERPGSSDGDDGEVAILLISTNKEGFYELRQMRDDLVELLKKNGSLDIIRQAVRRGRPKCTDIVPSSPTASTSIRHFLYKSRGNVQFFMPSYRPNFPSPFDRRRLLYVYHSLHHALHTKPTHPKILHSTTDYHTTIAWSTPVFELYAIAPADTPRASLAQAANRVVQYVRREEERIFIIGGAVF